MSNNINNAPILHGAMVTFVGNVTQDGKDTIPVNSKGWVALTEEDISDKIVIFLTYIPNGNDKHFNKYCEKLNITSKRNTVISDKKSRFVIVKKEDFNSISFSNTICVSWNDFYSSHAIFFSYLKMPKCCRCNKNITFGLYHITKNKSFICSACTDVLSYYTKNEKIVYKPNARGIKYGFELECVSKHKIDKDIAEVLALYKDLIPTRDGSLPSNGVEFKTPIMCSLKDCKNMINEMSNYFNFKNINCGQHINISMNGYNGDVADFLSSNYEPLSSLRKYMNTHVVETTEICGRYFTNYANCHDNYNVHSNWINLSHANRIEFRLSKIQSAEQYILLSKMWTDIMICLMNYYRDGKDIVGDYSKLIDVQSRYSKKLIKIFIRYSEKVKEMT